MDDQLFAAIAAHLRRHNRRPTPAPRPPVWPEGMWSSAEPGAYCRWCGRPIVGGDGLFSLDQLRQVRACADHFMPF